MVKSAYGFIHKKALTASIFIVNSERISAVVTRQACDSAGATGIPAVLYSAAAKDPHCIQLPMRPAGALRINRRIFLQAIRFSASPTRF